MNAFPVPLPDFRDKALLWAEIHQVQPEAIQQIRNTASMPWVHGVRVMPDVHVGKGAAIGSVIAMRGAVSPMAVGVDIGCGMLAVRTNLKIEDLPDSLAELRSRIESAIPVGPEAHKDPVDLERIAPLTADANQVLRAHFWEGFDSLNADVSDLFEKALLQLGTLGSGNHFIELCADERDAVWLQLHSGSRHIGKAIADQHTEIAKALPHNNSIADHNLAVFVKDSQQLASYLADVDWAQQYAARSRHYMMTLVADVVRRYFEVRGKPVEFEILANVHHNYVAEEEIDGEMMLVTRKGAIRAGRGEIGVIPGSMGTGSYIVRGLGNPLSYQSASHGAGRRMSRRAARRTFDLTDLNQQTDGVECRKDIGVLDEIPAAYKDIDAVMRDQADLVEPVARLRTLLCVKG